MDASRGPRGSSGDLLHSGSDSDAPGQPLSRSSSPSPALPSVPPASEVCLNPEVKLSSQGEVETLLAPGSSGQHHPTPVSSPPHESDIPDLGNKIICSYSLGSVTYCTHLHSVFVLCFFFPLFCLRC